MKKYKLILITIIFAILLSILPVSTAMASDISQDDAVTAEASFDDLSGLRGAVKEGSIMDTVLESLVTDARPVYFKTMTDQCIAVQQGKADYALVIREQYSFIAEEYSDLVTIDDLTTSCGQVGYVFNKDAESDALRAEIDAYIEELEEGGELEKLQDYWFTPGEKKTLDIPKTGENGVIWVATGAVSPPLVYAVEDSYSGYEVELLANFAASHGYGLEFEIVDLSGLLPAVTSGKCDIGMNSLIRTEEREKSVSFSLATCEPEYVIIMKRDKAAALFGTEQAETNKEKTGFFSKVVESFRRTFIVEKRWKLILRGSATTLAITLLSSIIGIILGLQLYRAGACRNRVIRGLAYIFTSFMGGTPMVVLLMIFYYIIFGSVDIPAFFVAVLAFGLNLAASVSQIFASCIDSIDPGQTEAALALGYSRRKTFHRFILPQAMQQAIPLIKGQIIALLKGTAIVGFISIQDLTKMGDIIRSRTYEAFFPLIAVALIYFLFAWLIGVAISKIEIERNPINKRDKRLAALRKGQP